MVDNEFNKLADAVLDRIECGLENSSADLDFTLVSEGVLEIEFGDGSKMVVNRHGATEEIWVAARSGGFHFRWDGKVWRDTREGTELFSALSNLVSAQAGEPVRLA